MRRPAYGLSLQLTVLFLRSKGLYGSYLLLSFVRRFCSVGRQIGYVGIFCIT